MNGFLADVPVVIGRDDARNAAAAELGDARYRAAEPSWFSRVLQWISNRIGDLLSGLSGGLGGPFGILVLVTVVAVVVVVILLRTGRISRTERQRGPVFAGGVRSAAEYRKAAEDAAARGEFDEAVRECFRALARSLEERALLDERSGRTADEVALDAGRLLPELAAELRDGARAFDDVHYGGRHATEATYRRLAELDQRCRSARPVALAGS